MSEAKFDNVLKELRETAPAAPERLRELVRTLPSAQPRRTVRLRPALSAAMVIALAVGIGAAVVGGLNDSRPDRNAGSFLNKPPPDLTAKEQRDSERSRLARPDTPFRSTAEGGTLAPTLTAKSRLQRQNINMSLRVRDLSGATQTAVRHTRRLGGYVAAADYATEADAGDSLLDLRVPVQNLQEAIARFTDLGTILSQRIVIDDLQVGVDRIDRRLSAARKTIAELEAKPTLTSDEQRRLAEAKQTVTRLTRSRAGLVQEARYAKVSLELTTRTAAKTVEPGRFDRFWDNATDILGKELIAVLYVLVVAGPFLLLAALALFAERARRRRADHRLLEETG